MVVVSLTCNSESIELCIKIPLNPLSLRHSRVTRLTTLFSSATREITAELSE